MSGSIYSIELFVKEEGSLGRLRHIKSLGKKMFDLPTALEKLEEIDIRQFNSLRHERKVSIDAEFELRLIETFHDPSSGKDVRVCRFIKDSRETKSDITLFHSLKELVNLIEDVMVLYHKMSLTAEGAPEGRLRNAVREIVLSGGREET